MRVRVNTWSGFRPGDVIVENPGSPEPVVVEREAPPARFGTAQVEGETQRGFVTGSGKRFVYPVDDGYDVTQGFTDFVEDPDWKSAVDGYARRLENVRQGIISVYPARASDRQTLLAILDDGNAPPKPAPLQLSRERLKAAVDESLARFDLGPASYVSRSELVVRAVEMLLQEDLGIEPKA